MKDSSEFNLLGKDYLTEAEAAHYCCVSLSHFQQSTDTLAEAGVRARRNLGKKVFLRAELSRMIENAPTWFPVVVATGPRMFNGQTPNFESLVDPLGNLTNARLRPYVPRKKRTETPS
ncbi:hypothetical protein [Dokdonella ginsengisoli]|uniref:DNA-binding protein n=1 Tax=Dokdonella ginsengisoli TaxID=363846 RepID=A0ABV9QRA0_9GAMM